MAHDEGMTTTRTAIVTGAARGIGRAIALRLATDGHHVAVLDLDESACQAVVDEITEGGGTALAVGVDVSDAEQVEAGVARVAEELGAPVSYTHLTLPTIHVECRSRWSPYH